MRNRSVGSHRMNDYSSRSHTILSVHITSEQQAENGVFISKQGKINFVDLAGSEMTKKTNSEGKTLEEANNINKSLMVLGESIILQIIVHKVMGKYVKWQCTIVFRHIVQQFFASTSWFIKKNFCNFI